MRVHQRRWGSILFTGWLFLAALTGSRGNAMAESEPVLFVSSFAPGEKGAITAFTFDVKTGGLKSLQRTGEIEHPFFLVLSPKGDFLYAIHAPTFGGKEPEQVAAYAHSGSGKLTLLNRQSTRGTASCYLDVDATGKTLLLANYTSGSVAALPIATEGKLGEATSFFQHTGSSVNPDRQKEPHAHCFVIAPGNRFAYAADLGTDQILGYRLDAAKSTLSKLEPPFVRTAAGAGPRHLTFHPNGKLAYVINELANTIQSFTFDPASGQLTARQTISTVPGDFKGVSHTADLKFTPDGKFLYGTNRGHDSLACYQVSPAGDLTLLEIISSHGKGPQNLLIAGGGKWLLCANMPGNNVAIFSIDPQSGRLTLKDQTVEIVSPSCLRLVP